MFIHGLVREKTHMRTYPAYAHGGKKARESQSHERRLSGLFVLSGNRKDEEHEMGFSGHSGRI